MTLLELDILYNINRVNNNIIIILTRNVKEEKEMEEKRYLKWYQKMAYGSGDMAANCSYGLITSFLLIYLTNTVGLNSVIIGTLMMVSKIFDGFTDVFFGTMMDRTRSKWGKARPWMFFAQIGVSASMFLVFSIPSMSKTMQYVYFFVFYTAYNAVFFTANNIAYTALSALITRNPEERVQLGSIRFMFSLAINLVIMYTATSLVEKFGGGAQGWRTVALIFAILGFVINAISVFSVKELPEEKKESEEDKPKDKIKFLDSFKMILRNPYFILIVVLYILYNGGNSITQGVGIYFCTYVFDNPALLGTISMASMVPMIFILGFTPMLVKKFGTMRKVNIWGYILSVVAGVLFVFAAVQKNIPLLMFAACIRTIGVSPLTGTFNALIASVADYSWRKEGVRVEGAMFSCSSIGVKVGGGIGSALTGLMLGMGGFDGTAAVQSTGAVNMIFFMYTIVPLITAIGVIVLLYFLKVEKANEDWDKTHKGEFIDEAN